MKAEVVTGSALEVLQSLEAGSAQTCVTSPPYWGLRAYGTNPQVWGGEPGCRHDWSEHSHRARDNRNGKGSTQVEADVKRFHDNLRDGSGVQSAFCSLCGAWRGELGLEPTPELYVEHLVQIFREVRRTLKDDGTLWLNLGDSYWGGKGENGSSKARATARERGFSRSGGTVQMSKRPQDGTHHEIKPKDLVGIPWVVAFALRADGWYLRSDIIWHKPNPMPESVTDRPTKAHEYIFLLSKGASYYYDAEAIKEQASQPVGIPRKTGQIKSDIVQYGGRGGKLGTNQGDTNRNRRSVWTVSTKPFKGAHFATFPEKLIEPCILAGSREGDTVLDPFSGAGTTGVVAVKHGRNFIGVELNPDYAEMARGRIQKETRQPLLTTAAPNQVSEARALEGAGGGQRATLTTALAMTLTS